MNYSTAKPKRALLAALAASSVTPIVLAHHSFAMFDAQQTLTAEGTVKDFQWGNPHVWLDVLVHQPDGGVKSLSLELNGISGLVRHGWKPATLHPADKVKVTYHPLRDGAPGGQLIEVVTADGTVLKGQ